MIKRHLGEIYFNPDFGRQMPFVVRPRQVGKKTLARSYLDRHNMPSTYYNWQTYKMHYKIKHIKYFSRFVYDQLGFNFQEAIL